jgi:SAM-dependent methyltransferase
MLGRMAPPAPTPRDEGDAAALAAYLLSFRWPFRHDDVERELVAGGMRLWQEILRRVPQPTERGQALELGSPPFHITLLLQRFRNYELTLAGCATDDRPEIMQELESSQYGERHVLRCRCFDVERDRFPFPDGAFDLVTCCEVIEHLTENPVHALAEIHRVLRPGGWFVLSTPNAARAGSIANLLRGSNVYDPYHLGTPLRGSRHSREYTLGELRDLIAGCGFALDLAEDVDLTPASSASQRAFRLVLNRVVSPLTGAHHRAHLFVRARRTAAPFRPYYPAALFDGGHLAFHVAPASAAVTVGVNERGHLALGWGEFRRGAGARAARRAGPIGDLYLRPAEQTRRVVLTLSSGRGEAEVWDDNEGSYVLLGRSPFDVPAGEWSDLSIALGDGVRPGSPIHVRLLAPDGVDLHAAVVE